LIVAAATVALVALSMLAPPGALGRYRHGGRRHRVVATRATAVRARPSPSAGTTGYDISYPQCGSPYPTGQPFGVVGVNGGLANDANGCFASELSWALSSPGLASPFQPPASLYINTADPGPGTSTQPIADWPTSGSSSAYGTCSGGWTTACAYVYGEQRASYSYGLASAVNQTVASHSPWWLDIETANSWATSSTAGYAALNIATIQGFVTGLQSAGATGTIGIYSTAAQWQAITGLTSTTSQSYFPNQPDWVAGGRSRKQAQANCSASFTGGHVGLAQYPSGGFDADLACP
jgi:hypothetical protein